MEEKDIKIIKESIEEIITKMGFDGKVNVKEGIFDFPEGKEEKWNNLIFDVDTSEDSNFLIGQQGVNLQALQHIIRLIIRKRIDSKVGFILDVNSYRQQKNESLIKLAKAACEQAVSEKKAIIMKPMSPYERRIVHLTLSSDERVITESVGENESRKIIVKPANLV